MAKVNSRIKKDDDTKALFFQRLVAFLIDVFLVSLVVSILSIPFTRGEEVDSLQEDATQLMEKFSTNDVSMEEFTSEYVDIYYRLARSSGFTSLISIFVGICYYVVYQTYQKGQTIGKRLMKIRVVSDDGELFMNQMILRSFLANFLLMNIGIYVFMLFSSKYVYFYSAAILELIQYLMIFVSIIMIMYRHDGCAIHDKLLHTRVIREN